MPIEFNCPHCLKGYRVADSNVGKRVKCKVCGEPMTVPDLSGLSFADDTREVQRPKRRASSTKILPADRPARKQNQVHSETVKLRDKPPPRAKPQPKAEAAPAPPKGKLPGAKLPTGLKPPPSLPGGAKAPGTRSIPDAPKKRGLNFIFLLGTLAMIVGFFLPLFNPGLPDFDEAIAAFTLPLSGGKLAAAMVQAGVYADQPLVTGIHGNPDSALTLFALYLVPVLALYGIVDELRCAGKGKSHWWLRILAMLSPALALGAIYVVFREQLSAFAIPNINTSDTIAALGPGAWTLGGGWLFALLGIVIAPKVKKPKTPELPERKTPATKALPGKPKLPAPRKPE